ncbi:MAG: response regulator [Acidobacteria bacterium]|nr:response regulator [Acidobacteriota bacterium]MBI3422365.1 response regulator [Acidobacteriota bacterium]
MSNPLTGNTERLILVVEDSRMQAQMLCFHLEEAGFSWLLAENGKQALELLRAHRPALIVAEVALPELDGFELARQIKADENLNHIPLILLTVLTDGMEVLRGLECGADNFITKPYEPAYLLARINYLLANRPLCEQGKSPAGLELEFNGKRHLITAERRQILDLWLSTCEQYVQLNRHLHAREKDLKSTSNRLSVLHDIAVTISQSLDLDEILQAAPKKLQATLNVEVAAIFLQEEEGLVLRAHRHLPKSMLRDLATTNLAQSQLAEICRQGEVALHPLSPALFATPGEALPSAAPTKRAEPYLAGLIFMFVPLKAKKTVSGLLVVGPFDPLGAVNEMNQELMEAIANQLAVAVENARLYEAAQKARQQAEAANQAKDGFLALVSHELRAPLNAILGWTSALLNKAVDDEVRRRALETIERSARTQTQLIEDLLDMARAVSGKLRLEVRPVDLSDVINAALDVMRPAAEAKAIDLRVQLRAKDDIITGDPDRLQQVFWNLLSNAIKFTPNNGVVEIKLERADPHVQITVRDTGKGIVPEFLPYVFERFRQADSSNTRRHSGLGLGLALVKQLVELHGGTVQAESAGTGQGATFTVMLPVRAVRAQTAGTTQEMLALKGIKTDKRMLLAGLTILVVDDEPDAREVVTAVLEHYGADVLSVNSAAEALDLLRKVKPPERPDVIVSDIAMPGEDGYALIRQVRALPATHGGSIPAVALTAFGRSGDRVRALTAGFQMHVPKPVEAAELALVIANLARRNLQ